MPHGAEGPSPFEHCQDFCQSKINRSNVQYSSQPEHNKQKNQTILGVRYLRRKNPRIFGYPRGKKIRQKLGHPQRRKSAETWDTREEINPPKNWITGKEAHEEDPDEGEQAGPHQGDPNHPPGLCQVGEHPLTHLTDVEQGGESGHGHRQVTLERRRNLN